MKAIEISQFGGPQVLRLVDRDPPTAQAGELLIQVYAAGVNRPDVLQRKGYYPPPPGASDLPGLEVAGVVSGGDLSSGPFSLGDPVCALLTGGGYAQVVAAPVGQVLPMPQGLSFVEAAGLPEAFFTVWSNLVDRAHLVRGESLLVHGGTSGIGVAAIGLAVARGATVLATAGTDAKCRACESLGARSGINYRSEDFPERVLALTDGRGVDVVLDMVAGDYVARDLQCMAPDGRLVLIAPQGG
ncbi:MAG TPA: NAD(P)H-quinone oxidoreductase, partial [Burkholderiaceae bacterium]|nr:NAD(P)H-quinone oxidoreductase [Burkholderiaceae bacterium]